MKTNSDKFMKKYLNSDGQQVHQCHQNEDSTSINWFNPYEKRGQFG
jgi:hypothetical protein